jgi:hypothetical protein
MFIGLVVEFTVGMLMDILLLIGLPAFVGIGFVVALNEVFSFSGFQSILIFPAIFFAGAIAALSLVIKLSFGTGPLRRW